MRVDLWRWLRASAQSTTILGLAMLAVLWGSVVFHLNVTHENDLQGAKQETANLARAFEEHIARAIRGIDGTLIVLRAMYAKDPKTFTFVDWSKSTGLVSDAVLQYAIINPAGRLVASSLGDVPPMDLSDREHYRVHLNNTADELFIGKPLIGRASGKISVQLSRRFNNPDGSLAGVIVASLDPAQLTKFYETIDVGRDGAISLNGLDGVVRAQRGFKKQITQLGGKSDVLKRIETAPTGTFIARGAVDDVVRILSYRVVAGLPLYVVAGLGHDEVLAQHYRDRVTYLTVAAGVSLLVLIVIGLSIAHWVKLHRTYDKLRKSESGAREKRNELRTTLENIDQGIIMVDGEGTMQVINRRIVEMLDLPDEWLASGRKLKDLLAYLWDRGEFENNDFDPKIRNMLLSDGLFTGATVYERIRPSGAVLEVRTLALPEGGLVRTFTDITERKRAQAKIADMATHDELTGLANRNLFRSRLDQALVRAQRYGESFALLVLDLDRFKAINDTRGHPAGDTVLKEVARRLSFCVHANHTAARLGGDEFAILQTPAKSEDETGELARRIVKAMSLPIAIAGQNLDVGISIGITRAPRDGASYDQLVTAADRALYQAKKGGGNIYSFYRSGMAAQPSPSEVKAIRVVS